MCYNSHPISFNTLQNIMIYNLLYLVVATSKINDNKERLLQSHSLRSFGRYAVLQNYLSYYLVIIIKKMNFKERPQSSLEKSAKNA